jgi:mxaK protein
MTAASRTISRVAGHALGRLSGYRRRAKGFVAAALPAACAIAFVVSASFLAKDWLLDRTIADLAAGKDVAVVADAAPAAVFARVLFLINHARLDDAQPLGEALDRTGSPSLRAAAHYDLANARLRNAMEDLVRGRIDPAIPLVVLARADYRQALRLDPSGWDIKFNTDVADRLIRDFPAGDTGLEDHEPSNAGKLWKQVPGVPEGLP